MSLQDQYAEAANPATQQRVQMAAASTAQAIGSEPESAPNHADRAALASAVSRNPTLYTQAFATMVCAEGITSASTDEEIESMVSAVWNTMADGMGPPPVV